MAVIISQKEGKEHQGTNTVETVHIIYKTHLDIGYTDAGKDVLDQYVQSFIPKAIELAEQLENEAGPEKFIWTTGSWLIDYYLKHSSPKESDKMRQAIKKGHIVWHGLPFTTHTEIADERLFEAGLNISKRLDSIYGKQTISSKMTDVPGHTIAMVPKMAKYGIKYLHLGTNPGSKMPNVPPLFVWKADDGSELIVNYHDTYGAALEVEGISDALVFAHTMDNYGPPSVEDIKELYTRLSEKYPGATIKASTLDAFAAELLQIKDRLPVVTEEIGDSWIHGISSDPLKISKYRELLRLRDQWIQKDPSFIETEEYQNFSEELLLIPEHTWGADIKRYIPDFESYEKEAFNHARQKDIVDPIKVPNTYSYAGVHARVDVPEKLRYSFVESTWNEQREYLENALHALSTPKREEAEKTLESIEPVKVDTSEFTEIDTYTTYRLGEFNVSFTNEGALEQLIDRNGKVWADEENTIGHYQYQTFGLSDYERWYDQYHVKWKQNQNWVIGDFGKPGMEYAIPKPENRMYQPRLKSILMKSNDNCDLVITKLIMPEKAVVTYGAPRELRINYKFYKGKDKIDITLDWFEKDANRLPEASWFSFIPKVGNPNLWKIDKLGSLISPLNVVTSGNRNMHGGETGVFYEGADGKVKIESLDAPIVSFGKPRLLQFDNTFADLTGGIHYNLHNNVWGTNFRMWYEEDTTFRFTLSFQSY